MTVPAIDVWAVLSPPRAAPRHDASGGRAVARTRLDLGYELVTTVVMALTSRAFGVGQGAPA